MSITLAQRMNDPPTTSNEGDPYDNCRAPMEPENTIFMDSDL